MQSNERLVYESKGIKQSQIGRTKKIKRSLDALDRAAIREGTSIDYMHANASFQLGRFLVKSKNFSVVNGSFSPPVRTKKY